jgi:hypothetical protein
MSCYVNDVLVSTLSTPDLGLSVKVMNRYQTFANNSSTLRTGVSDIALFKSTVVGSFGSCIASILLNGENCISDPIPPETAAGIYKMVRGKLNDTLYTSPTTTENVKIPGPFASTHLIGDE